MKTNMIIGKKQIVLSSLVLVLGIAVYLNWTFANSELESTLTMQDANNNPSLNEIVITNTNGGSALTNTTATNDETPIDDTKKLGDTLLVNAQLVSGETYFVTAKLARDKARDLSISTVSTILDNVNLSQDDKATATLKAVELADVIELENKVENLVKAKGYQECMVFINNDSVNLVVMTTGLSQSQATQLKNIIVTECDVKGENVSISEVNI